MPTRDTGEHAHKSRSDADVEQVEETAAAASDLAERKEALETNAEEFVRGFVQKGGQ